MFCAGLDKADLIRVMAIVIQVSNVASGFLVFFIGNSFLSLILRKNIRNSNKRMASLMKYDWFFL